MAKRNIEAVYPLSPMQQGMLFHSLYSPESGVYCELMTCSISGELNISAFEYSWQETVNRYSILRTSFVWKKIDRMLQVVHKQVQVKLEVLDWDNQYQQEFVNNFENFLEKERIKGFDYSKPPLFRLILLKQNSNLYRFAWIHHHTLLDGWSMPIIFQDVMTFYESYVSSKPCILNSVHQYREYINWLQKQNVEEAKAYWKEILNGFDTPSTIIKNIKTNNNNKIESYSETSIVLPKELSSLLTEISKQYQVTLSTILQGAWAYLLSRYCGTEDIVFGVTVSGRPSELPDVEKIVGLFINTIPIRVKINPDETVKEWLKKLQNEFAFSRQYEYSPLYDIHEWSDVPGSTPLFDSIFIFENYPIDTSIRDKKLSIKITNFETKEQTNYPITLVSAPSETLTIKISFDTRLLELELISQILGHLKNVIVGMAENINQELQSISILNIEETDLLINQWNKTDISLPDVTCIQHLFENQVKKTPDSIAIIEKGRTIPYLKLNQQANWLAKKLKGMGVGPEVLVGICSERSTEMIVAILGVLKAGGAYVPLDPSYPVDRLNFMVSDAHISILLTQSNLLSVIPSFEGTVICLDQEFSSYVPGDHPDFPCRAQSDNLAYVIYTSGTTGLPKGVMIEHHSLINLVSSQTITYELTSEDRVLQFISISFDAAGEEIFPALSTGAAIVLYPEDHDISAQKIVGVCEQNKVSVIHLPVALWHLIVQEIATEQISIPEYLRLTIVGGESPSNELLHKWKEFLGFRNNVKLGKFINSYGPTETTITSLAYIIDLDKEFLDYKMIPIGRPIGNTKVYILDHEFHPLPVYVPGELFIGGSGIARGYINQPELSSQRFIPNPFINGMRLYRSGDIAKYLPDGNIEFIGRIDTQVKIRGYRVEIGEIETTLQSHLNILNAIVIPKNTQFGIQLNAFIVLKDLEIMDFLEIKAFLTLTLPDYMIPANFYFLKEFPRTPAGKIDRRKLSELNTNFNFSRKPEEFFNPVEEVLGNIWKDILDISLIGLDDNFFDLGGHSLSATQLISRIREAFLVEISLRDFFETPTIRDLARLIETAKNEVNNQLIPPLFVEQQKDIIPLSFAQQRLWFLDQLSPGNLFYNIPVALRFIGNLDLDALKWSINKLIQRHEILRTVFKNENGIPVQVILDTQDVDYSFHDLYTNDSQARDQQALSIIQEGIKQPFDLNKGPLFRIFVIRINVLEHMCLFMMHHIVTDGWSMMIMVKELAHFYKVYISDPNSTANYQLDHLSIQYSDYAIWQKKWLSNEILNNQLAYWKEQLSDIPRIINLPLDRPRPAIQSSKGATFSFTFPEKLLAPLQKLIRESGVTNYMVLLTAFQVLLHRYTGQDDILVGTPIANRNRKEIESLIGFFVNTLVIRTRFADQITFRELLKQVRTNTIDAYTYQDLPFELLVETLQPERDLSHTPIFQVAFSLQNYEINSLSLPGLEIIPIELDNGTAKYDLTLVMSDSSKGLSGSFEYNTDLFNQSTIIRIVNHLQILVESIITDPDQKISLLPILTQDERQQILMDWNATDLTPPSNNCAHELFEMQALNNPDGIALIFEGKSITYSELDRKANQLANYLIRGGVKTENIVGIYANRSIEMILGILGVMKAGGAYLPLDPNYPSDRLAFMVQDSNLQTILTQNNLLRQIPSHQANIIRLDSDWLDIKIEPEDKPDVMVRSDNLAYVIYTSGSTGKPKGTLLTHRGLSNLTCAQKIAFNIHPGTRILQFSPYSFDASVWEIFMALANGATLCLVPQEILASGLDLAHSINELEITNITLPPSVLRVLPDNELQKIETVVAAGEACTIDLVKKWATGRKFFNAYGPTETTVCASMYLCSINDDTNPPIGRPIANTKLYILDKNQQPVPVKVPGELYVSGISLARGYLNRPELTDEKFIPSPFLMGGRLYRTGDLACFREDGNIEFLGRIDQQVKIRGFRIELGEIEKVLVSHPSIMDGVVISREDHIGETRLIGYVVIKEGSKPTVNEIRNYLRNSLPDYMIPALIIFLDQFPFSPSGKVDRAKLPTPQNFRSGNEVEYVTPRNTQEEELTKICQDLLGLEKVGINDNFFEIGGHSLLATQFISRIRDLFKVEIQLRTLFEHPTIIEISEQISKQKQNGESDTERISRLLSKIDQLSKDEVLALLAEKKGLLARGESNE